MNMYSKNIVGLGAVGKKPRLKSGDTNCYWILH